MQPVSTLSLKSGKYVVSIIDDFSHFTIVYFLKNKSQTIQTYNGGKIMANVQTSIRLKGLQTYGGAEYNSLYFQKFFKDKGINHQITTPHMRQQNGGVKHKTELYSTRLKVCYN